MQNTSLSDVSPNIQGDKQVTIEIGNDEMNEYEDQSFMPQFFEEVGQIKTSMSLIRKNIKTIQDIYDKQSWSSVESSQRNKVEELEELMGATNGASGQVRNQLKQMKSRKRSVTL